jgi:hypothetical protein
MPPRIMAAKSGKEPANVKLRRSSSILRDINKAVGGLGEGSSSFQAKKSKAGGRLSAALAKAKDGEDGGGKGMNL